MKDFAFDYIRKLKHGLDNLDLDKLSKIVGMLETAKDQKKQIFIFGNGGSAATASHFACDLGKGTITDFDKGERYRVIALSDNISMISAYGNDMSYDDIYSEQLKNLVNEGDVVIGISASGNSENILRAIDVAKDANAKTIALLGFDGGKLKDKVDVALVFEDDNYGRSEDAHLIIEHILTQYLKLK